MISNKSSFDWATVFRQKYVSKNSMGQVFISPAEKKIGAKIIIFVQILHSVHKVLISTLGMIITVWCKWVCGPGKLLHKCINTVHVTIVLKASIEQFTQHSARVCVHLWGNETTMWTVNKREYAYEISPVQPWLKSTESSQMRMQTIRCSLRRIRISIQNTHGNTVAVLFLYSFHIIYTRWIPLRRCSEIWLFFFSAHRNVFKWLKESHGCLACEPAIR